MKNLVTFKRLPFYIVLLIVAFLPFNFFLGPSILLLFLAILSCQSIKQTLYNLRHNKLFILFTFCYIIYLLGMMWTENQAFGKRDLEYKLSLLFLPIFLSALNRLEKKNFLLITKVFIVSCIVAAISSFIISYSNNSFSYIPTYIELSIFMHPSYFSTYINLGLVFLFNLLRFNQDTSEKKILIFALVIFFIGFNLLLNSKIGTITTVLLVLIFLIQSLRPFKKKSALLFISFFIAVLVILFSQVDTIKSRFQSISNIFTTENIPKDSKESSRLRVLIWQEVFEILEEQPLLGVGTGDTKDELVKSYKKNGITYAYNNRLNAHNQYLEWLLTFGIIGTLIWLISFLVPMLFASRIKNQLYLFFCLIVLMVFLAESFLEREYGVVFFAFFNSLLFFHAPVEKEFSE
ncbi:MAG: O-antigen ligase family protein [Vicingaceae bacterium]